MAGTDLYARWRWALFSCVLPIAFFWPQITGKAVFDNADLWKYFYPYRQAVVDAAQASESPLWNPYAFAGIPLSGDGQTAIFYPPNWFAYCMLVPHAVCLAVSLHFAIAGIGMYGFCRSLRLSSATCTFGSVAFGLNGFLVARIGHPSIMAGAALIPWVFWATQNLLERGRIWPLGIAIAAQILTGHPQIPAYTAFAVLIYAAIHEVRGRLSFWIRLAASALIGLALSAAQWLPWLSLVRFSPRVAGASFKFVAGDAMQGLDWLLYLFPYAFGGTRFTMLNTASVAKVAAHTGERLAYVGLLPLILALWAAVWAISPRKNHASKRVSSRRGFAPIRIVAISLLTIAFVMAIISAGENTIFADSIYWIPILGKMRNMTRAAGVLTFCACALASIGFEQLTKQDRRKRTVWPSLICASVICVAVIGALLAEPLLGKARLVDWATRDHAWMLGHVLRFKQANGSVPLSLAVASVIVTAGLAIFPGRASMLFATALVVVDLGALAATYQASTDPSAFSQTPLAASFLLDQPGAFRVVNLAPLADAEPASLAAKELMASWCMRFGIEDINGYNSLQPRRNVDLVASPLCEDITYAQFNNVARLDINRPLSGLFNIRFALLPSGCGAALPQGWLPVFNDPDITIFQNPDFVARAHWVDRIVVEPDPRRELAIVTNRNFDPAHQATVDTGLSVDQAVALSHSNEADWVRCAVRKRNSLDLQCNCQTPRLVEISQNWFPGWQARIDPDTVSEQTVSVLRSDYAFSAVIAPAGKHTIRLEYRPTLVLQGLLMTIASTAVCVAVGSWRFFGRFARSIRSRPENTTA